MLKPAILASEVMADNQPPVLHQRFPASTRHMTTARVTAILTFEIEFPQLTPTVAEGFPLSLCDFVRRRLLDERRTTKKTVVGETKRQDSNNTEAKAPTHNLERELQFYSTACSFSRLLSLDTLKTQEYIIL